MSKPRRKKERGRRNVNVKGQSEGGTPRAGPAQCKTICGNAVLERPRGLVSRLRPERMAVHREDDRNRNVFFPEPSSPVPPPVAVCAIRHSLACEAC